MTLLNTLMETCVTLTQKVAHLEQDKVTQALEITKLKQRVKKLERKRRSKHSSLKRRMHLNKGKIAELDADEDVTLVVVDTAVEMDADIQERMEEDVTTVKEINVAESEPTVFNDKEVTMTMDQILIKMKAKKARIPDEQLAKRLQDEEIKQATAREKQEKQDLEIAKASVSVKKTNDAVKLQALIDRKKVVVIEDTIRQDLRLDDADGVECLPNEDIFVELACMGYEKPPPKITFYKAFFSAQWKFLIHTIVQCMSAKRTAWNKFSSSMASAVICLAT
nr:synaptobrevin, longin-like domain protein [Tanacetum cinerariifolium]